MSFSRQEIFDKAVSGIIAQDALAQNRDGYNTVISCFYFDLQYDTGRKCALGQLLSDEDAVHMEQYNRGMSIASLTQPDLDKFGIAADDVEFAQRLQSAHDHSASVDDFLCFANDLAKEFKLEPYHAQIQA